MDIVWFPGHMAKTRREMKENLKLVDAVIELRDARIVKSSRNPEIDELCQNKPRIILLNKSDLSESKVTRKWIETLTKSNIRAVAVNCMRGEGIKEIKPLLNNLLKEKQDRMKSKGIINITTRAMVVGIPNVGKSTLINKIAKNSIAKTGDRPGVTKHNQWIKSGIGIELLDTPGVLWPKFEDKETALSLAFTGAIKDEIMDIEELSFELLKKLTEIYPERIMERYKLNSLSDDNLANFEQIGKNRGAVKAKGEIDYTRVAVMLLDEFRGGKLGPISIERP